MRIYRLLPLLLLFMLAACTDEVTEEQIKTTEITATDAITITAPATIDASTITPERVLMTNAQDERMDIAVTADEQRMTLTPPAEGFPAGEYTITVTPSVLRTDGSAVFNEEYIEKIIVPVRYRVESYDNSTVSVVGEFATLQQAQAAMTDKTYLFDGNTAIDIPDERGLLLTSNEGITILYDDFVNGEFKHAASYVAANSEVTLLQKGEQAIKVSVANETYYIEHGAHTYVPFYHERSHYYVEDGALMFRVMNYQTQQASTFAVGPAPKFMQANNKYYSEDGYTFTDAAGKQLGVAPPYFQFLSLRSKTLYTAEQLDEYIEQMLQQREELGEQYANATTTSKLLGLGTILKQIEEQFHINALLILALAQHESDYGMSNHAQTYNNLFGLYVFDSDPANKEFTSIEANVTELVTQFLNKNYIPWTAGYAHGAYFGNKVQGVNVRYASDQFWGVKAAGHAYRIDRALGGKELNRFTLAQISDDIGASRLHVRATASDEQAAIYTIKPAPKQFVTAFATQSSQDWLTIVSDSGRYAEGYIPKKYMTAQ